MDLAKESDYGSDLDVSQLFHDWENNKQREFLTYRDQVTSKIPTNIAGVNLVMGCSKVLFFLPHYFNTYPGVP